MAWFWDFDYGLGLLQTTLTKSPFRLLLSLATQAFPVLSMGLLGLCFGAGKILDAELQIPRNIHGQQSPGTHAARGEPSG